MSEIKKPAGLPPLTMPQGQSRTEGTLLTDRSTIKRKPKSAFLRKLERQQKAKSKVAPRSARVVNIK